jgi:predicted ABC-type ATPase
MTMRTDTRLYTPPENLGAGTPGDPFRTTPRDFTQTGRTLAGRPVRPPFPGARTGVGPRPDAPDTQRAYSETINGRTVYDTDRITAVHDPWVREMLEDGVRYEDTRVTFMGGGSGAGKGSVQRTGQVQFRPGSTVVDSDEAKRAIPEYRKMVDEGDTRAAAYAHEESSDMAARLMAESIENGFDTVLDGTGDSTFEKMAGKVAKAREQGARRVVAEYVTIDIDEAIRRAAQRAARTGREVPEDVINGTHSAVSRIFPRLADADTFDELRLWDNMGDTPQLIYERVDGVERILNRERYEAFLRKDPDYIPARPTVATPPPSAADIVYGTNDTQGVFTEVVNGKRRYTAARTQSVHRPWLDDLMREGQASDQPTMTFLGGGSGAGKGSITDPSKGGVVQFRPGSIKVDSDEAKRAIPEYRQLLDDDNPIAAAFVHEESSDMAAAALAESLERGFDTILDGTGDSSIEKLAAKVAKARQQGARRVTSEYVTIDIDEAVRRATSRAQRTGREVPLDVIQGTHESVSRVFPEAVRRNLFDEVRLWDNTGSPPELIYQKIDGVERILNPERYEAFLRKNPDYVSPTANIPAGPSTSARPIER